MKGRLAVSCDCCVFGRARRPGTVPILLAALCS